MTTTMLLRDVLEFTDDIGLMSYPIFDESYRKPLNDKIINHYLMREIGYETIDLFRMAIARKMNEIMPLYNKLYQTEMDFDPFITVDIETKNNVEGASETQNESTSGSITDGKSRAVSSEMPSEMLRGDGNYATTGADSTSNSTVDSTAEDNGRVSSESNSTTSTKGFQGDRVDVMVRYRDSVLNIDMMVINELAGEFYSLFSSTAGYSDPYPMFGYFGF